MQKTPKDTEKHGIFTKNQLWASKIDLSHEVA